MKRMWQKSISQLFQNHASLIVKIATVTICTLVLFTQDLSMIFYDAFQSEITSYILAIPFIFAYMIYRKRKMLRAVVPLDAQNQPKEIKHLPTIAGILLSTIAILLYWYGSYTFTPLEYHILALPVFLAGLTLIIFNYQTLRQLAFPIAFLILLTPPPSEILYGLGATLSVISAEASNIIINALGITSTLSSEYGNPIIQITMSNGAIIPFEVNIACSGVYSLIGFVIFAVFITYIIRDKLWKKATVFGVGLLLIYVLNIARITIILLIGYGFGKELALQIFHLLGGWALIFLGTLLLLIMSDRILKTKISMKPTAYASCPQCNPKPSGFSQNFCFECGRLIEYRNVKFKRQDAVKIVAVTLIVVLLFSIQTPVFALTQGPGVVIHTLMGEQATTQILPQIQEYTLKFVYRDTDFEQMAKQDASLLYVYVPNDETKDTVWVTLEIAPTGSSLHRWETCLIKWPLVYGYQPKVTQVDLRDIKLLENPVITARYFAFQYTNAPRMTQVVLYWFGKSIFQTNTTSQQKHVKISLIAYLNSPDTLPETEDQLAIVAASIAQYWQPIIKWTQLAILVSQNADNLSAITTVLLIAVTVLYVFKRRKKRKTNTNVYLKLSKPSKQIIEIICETEKKTITTLDNIAIAYQNKIGQPIDKEELLAELSEIEKTGTVESVIISRDDEPTLVWKTQLVLG